MFITIYIFILWFSKEMPHLVLSGSLPEGALLKLHLHLCYHLKEVRIVALPFYLYNMRLEEYVAIKLFNGSMC